MFGSYKEAIEILRRIYLEYEARIADESYDSRAKTEENINRRDAVKQCMEVLAAAAIHEVNVYAELAYKEAHELYEPKEAE